MSEEFRLAAPAALPPQDEPQLVERARDLAGRTIGEIAKHHGLEVPPDQRRAKGFVGQLVERTLGATAGSRDEPDFPLLGVELKTLPIGTNLLPRESTFVTTMEMRELEGRDWEESRVCRKLRRVLWVPVEADPSVALAARRFGRPLLWSPTAAQERALRQDWEAVALEVAAGRIEEIDAHFGEVLQVRPKGASGSVRKRAPDAAGGFVWTVPRGFYLRPAFTASVVGLS